MERTLILHIGTPKTGTTSIQSFLHDNRCVLETKGICYPDTRKYCKENGIDIGMAMNNVQNGGFFEHFVPLGVKKIYINQLLQNTDFVKIFDYIFSCFDCCDKVILSDESLWLRDISELLNFFYTKKIMIKVVVYFRNQIDYIESFWKHDIKMGLFTGSFTDFWKKRKDSAVRESLFYYRKLTDVANVISKQNIVARLYNTNSHKGNRNWLIEDFMGVLGLELDEGYCAKRVYENTSLFGSALIMKNKFNELGIDDSRGSFRQLFIQMSQQLVNENPSIKNTTFITQEMEQHILQDLLEDNHMLRQEYFSNIDEPIFDEFIKERIEEHIYGFNEDMFRFLIIYMQNEIALLTDMNARIDDIKNMILPEV